MKKKIMLIFLCLLFLFSCGKKGDPEYNAKITSSIRLEI